MTWPVMDGPEPSPGGHTVSIEPSIRGPASSGRTTVAIVSVNGVDLNVEQIGSGDPAVFVHGAWVDHHTWDPTAEALASTNRVISYDRRGHSASGNGDRAGLIDDD